MLQESARDVLQIHLMPLFTPIGYDKRLTCESEKQSPPRCVALAGMPLGMPMALIGAGRPGDWGIVPYGADSNTVRLDSPIFYSPTAQIFLRNPGIG